jgi:acyl-CoA thioesterase
VLVDVYIHAIHSGFAHGLAHLWAEDGTLLGTASQSMIVRFWEGLHGVPSFRPPSA